MNRRGFLRTLLTAAPAIVAGPALLSLIPETPPVVVRVAPTSFAYLSPSVKRIWARSIWEAARQPSTINRIAAARRGGPIKIVGGTQ